MHHDKPPAQLAHNSKLQAAARRGTILHQLLESLPDLSEDERRIAAEGYLARIAGAQEPVLSEEMQQQMIDDALAVLARAELADLFGDTALAEVPLAGVLAMDDGQKLALSGQIDRMVVTDNGVQLVDFKTGTPAQASENDRYMVQMAAYRALVQKLYPALPVTCLLVWTQNGRIDALSASALDAALAAVLSGQKRLA